MSTMGMVRSFDEGVDKYFEAHFRGSPALDRLMYTATAVGDHGVLWAVLAGIEGAVGRSRTSGPRWRPLARTAAALAVESALVNGLVKLGFRRERPQRDEPHPLPFRTPLTSSFPSGHASSAFFAAALLRRRRSWPLHYTLAAIVACSRIHVRTHHASDVVAGALLGAALGEVARRIFPVWEPAGLDRHTELP